MERCSTPNAPQSTPPRSTGYGPHLSAHLDLSILLSISPGAACLPVFDFSKIGFPSSITSKRPPLDGTSCTSASGYFDFISAARLVARGS